MISFGDSRSLNHKDGSTTQVNRSQFISQGN